MASDLMSNNSLSVNFFFNNCKGAELTGITDLSTKTVSHIFLRIVGYSKLNLRP